MLNLKINDITKHCCSKCIVEPTFKAKNCLGWKNLEHL